MKVLINGKQRDYRTVWMRDSVVYMIDQLMLPHKFLIYESKGYNETADAIRDMIVRGAPAIGATAAFGMAQAALQFNGSDFTEFLKYMINAKKTLSTRPTAHDLFYAVDKMLDEIKKAASVKEAKERVVKASQSYADESIERCRLIGEVGEKLIKKNSRILTHCNAGALGCVDYGTALAPMRLAHYNKKNIHVFVDETRPRCQGSRLTAWELLQEEIPHSIIVDNAAGFFMQRGEIDIVIVGADRITRNKDVINKIGTYEKAVIARENKIPFYVAAPESTFDSGIKDGGEVEIEERAHDEVLYINGVRIAPKNSCARNPAFDITPKRYVTGFITEKGILK
ncbi:MAG: S-methyl-5-thioribose-1-phosphate isomerase [Candidatus Altiarchaeota archaeon]|nr:S-methyl-5-thioribose-1-phosphate isomerase [Candidatus Altiarchaeota archaeon]